ncbi:MAG: hypothetical protein V9H69_20465 [Anaerolineae bacterium]
MLIQVIFGALAMGALLLLLAPWLGAGRAVIAPGMALMLLGTVALLVGATRQLGRAGLFAQPGVWHLLLAYAWILLPAAATPLILLSAYTLPMAEIEATAPQTLIYGWIARVSLCRGPLLRRRAGCCAIRRPGWAATGSAWSPSTWAWL